MTKFLENEQAERPVEVIGTGRLFMAEGKVVREGDRVVVSAILAHMLVNTGKAILAAEVGK